MHHKGTSTIPNIAEFQEYCTDHLRHPNIEMRPKLSAVLLHPYFNHEFVLIHSFLSELPLKSQIEKQHFFQNFIDRLGAFDEEIVGIQLTDLILSRMVVLDDTAKLCVIPFVLKPRTKTNPTPLFSVETFTTYILPKIQQLFLVRDSQIRLILLEYFPHYVNFITNKEQLSDHILPQLLLGIKDTNDHLVASTLRCLADLIPILGSAVVIGQNRGRLFADGRPNGAQEKIVLSASTTSWTSIPRSITPIMSAAEDLLSSSPLRDTVDISDSYISVLNSQNNQHLMLERLSPDGGEDVLTASEQPDIEDDGWSDWETEAAENTIAETSDQQLLSSVSGEGALAENEPKPLPIANTHLHNTTADLSTTFIKDIKQIDIKPKKTPVLDEIIDFFKEMEPIIAKTNILLIPGDINEQSSNVSDNATKSTKSDTSFQVDQGRFAIKPIENEEADTLVDDAWGHESNDWDLED